jgi:TPR repeat protein
MVGHNEHNEQMVLTHIPLLRIAEEYVPFAAGHLLRLTFNEFDYLVGGAFTDSKRDYERTAPVFYERPNPPEDAEPDIAPGVTAYASPETVTAALNLAAPALGLPRPNISFTIVVTGGPQDHTRQGDADLELLFHHEAARPPLSAEQVDTARALIPVVFRSGDEPWGAMLTLGDSAGLSLGIDERLTLCTVALEALLFPDVTTNSRDTFVRRLTNLVGGEQADEVAELADAIYRARTQALHRLPGERDGLDPAARCLLARAVIALDGADLGRLRDQLDHERHEFGEVPMPPLDWTGASPSEPLMRLPLPRRSMPSSWNPEQPDVDTDQVVAFFPLIGCDVDWPPPPGFPLTQLTAGQLNGLEDADIRRDWATGIDGCACIALSTRAESIRWAPDVAAQIDGLRPYADLAVQALRLAGLSDFVDPDLLGDFALCHGSSRYRRGTVFRQTAMRRGRGGVRMLTANRTKSGDQDRRIVTFGRAASPDDDQPKATIPQSAPELVALWSLLLDYDSGQRSAVIDEALVLFRRAHDSITLTTRIRLQLLFGCLELMIGRVPRPDMSHPIDGLRQSMLDAEPLDWYRAHGCSARNALAHGSWDDESDPRAFDQLLALARTLMPWFIGAWLNASRQPEPSKALKRALQKSGPVPWHRSPPEASRVAADQLRYAGLDIRIDLNHAQSAQDAGDAARERDFLRRAVAAMPEGVSTRPEEHVAALQRLGILERDAGDPETARVMLEAAAAFGNADAMNSLGVLERRLGNLDAARVWYGQAAEAGRHQAYFNQALMEEDEGKLDEAERLYRLAADAGDVSATYNLGCMLFAVGRGDEGLDQFVQAANAGHTGAMFNLGDLCRSSGDGERASYWFEMAAAGGDDRAQEALRSLRPS